MSNTKSGWKKLTSMRLFLPIVCLIAVLLVNVITTPGFFKVSINNGVLYGYIVDVINRASELVILAVGMTLVTAASGGQDISVGAVMAVAAAVCCQILSGGEVSVNSLSAPIIVAFLAALVASGICGAFNGGILALGMFFGRTGQNGPTDPKSIKCMELTHELHDWFKKANGKNAICCRILTKEFNMGQGEHKEQCIYFTGLCAWKVAQIVCRELGIKNLDEIDEPCERRKIADI